VKQKKTLFFFAALIASLVALVYWDEWQTKRDEIEKKAATSLIPSDFSQIEEIRFFSKASEEGEESLELRLKMADGKWRLTEPYDYLADQRTVENLLKTVFEYNYTKSVAEGSSQFENYGLLKNGSRKISFLDNGGKKTTVVVGMKAPVGYDVYSRVEGSDKIFIGSQYLLVATAKTIFDFRSKSFVSIDRDDIEKWSYFRKESGGNTKLDFSKNEKNVYVIGSLNQNTVRADQPIVRDFLDDIAALKTTNFIDTPDKKWQIAFSDPDLSVAWQNKEGLNSSILFVKQGAKYFASLDPSKLVFELPDNSHVRIEKDLMGFRDRRVFGFDSNDLRSLKIDGDQYVRIKGEWYSEEDSKKFDEDGKYTSKENQPSEQVHVRSLVGDLEFAKTFAYIQLNDPVIKKLPTAPSHRLVWNFKNDSESITADIFPAGDEKDYRFVKYNGGEYLYKIDVKMLQSISESSHEESAKQL
jgi:hypothetical protein